MSHPDVPYAPRVGRWEPDAGGRLRSAAFELFAEQGYESTTVADIAGRAGLTARTFFRHYADKREVLFAGSSRLETQLLAALAAAPAADPPLRALEAALGTVGEVLPDHSGSARRQAVIEAHAELRERELIKLATLSGALADGLRTRGVTDPEAGLAAEAAVAVFRVAFERWVTGPPGQELPDVLSACFAQLRALAGA